MKKLASVILLIAIVLSTNSCFGGFIYDNSRQIAKKQIESVLDAIQNKDKEKLTSLFSKNILGELQSYDESVDALFDYFNGSVESFDDDFSLLVEGFEEDGFFGKFMISKFDVKTDVCDYYFAMRYVTEGNENDVGITSLSIIKASEYDDSEYIYSGDSKYTPGIHIAAQRAEDRYPEIHMAVQKADRYA